ncbi:MAG TPA: hypothetical protein VK487_09605 [Candidatus Bathyarchaeia archaeon]|nr:hypothetical protein [Candidatus Bathyarchaeia archaeon]
MKVDIDTKGIHISTERESEKEKKEETKENYFWAVWGIGVAFMFQVLYDGIGETFPNLGVLGHSVKFWGGIIMGFFLFAYAFVVIRRK